MQRSKLYLNAKFSKLGTQLLRVLMLNGVHPEAPRAFQVERTVIDEETFFGRALGDFQSDAIDRFLGLPGANVTGTKKNEEVSPQIEGLNAELVEFERLVVDSADEILSGARDLTETGARIREFLRLRKHEGRQLLAPEPALPKHQVADDLL